MAAKLSPEMMLARALAAPFTPAGKGQAHGQGIPLSCRSLPDGGMVVIAADGRKLWFSAAEVEKARESLEALSAQEMKKEAGTVKRAPVKLASPPPEPIKMNSGKPLYMAVNKDQFKDL